jgi:hypothetical protein
MDNPCRCPPVIQHSSLSIPHFPSPEEVGPVTKLKSKDKSFRRARREFAKSLAAAAATPLMAKAGFAREADTAAQAPQPAANPFAPQAEALADVVRRRYGQHLNDEQLEAVKRAIERALRGGDTLHKFDLANGDEPAFTFSADLPEIEPPDDKRSGRGGDPESGGGRRSKRAPRRN